jgi:hypothetical protein
MGQQNNGPANIAGPQLRSKANSQGWDGWVPGEDGCGGG